MTYCSNCCQPDTRPKIVFTDGVCGACQWEETKKDINWRNRELELTRIANKAKAIAQKRGTYDCALGVSGGKDSTFVALYARDVLGLNCLLVSAVPDDITDIGQQNFNNLINQRFDCVRLYVNPELLKLLMRHDFMTDCHFRKATEYPLWASTFTVAKEKNIPLVIQGENAALTLGVSEDMNTDWDASTIWKTNTIAGSTAVDRYNFINPNKLLPYQFPDLTDWNGQAIWLNYFVKEWSQWGNAQLAMLHGMKVREDTLENTGRIHPWTCLDSDFHIVSQYHKYVKYGFGFATDEVCYDIREGRLTREEGFELIDKYDGGCADKYIDHFCEFVGIDRETHDEVVDETANKELMEKVGDRWYLKPELKTLRS